MVENVGIFLGIEIKPKPKLSEPDKVNEGLLEAFASIGVPVS
jgi:hypothetical protein